MTQSIKEKQKCIRTLEDILESLSHGLLTQPEPPGLSNCGDRKTRSFCEHQDKGPRVLRKIMWKPNSLLCKSSSGPQATPGEPIQ